MCVLTVSVVGMVSGSRVGVVSPVIAGVADDPGVIATAATAANGCWIRAGGRAGGCDVEAAPRRLVPARRARLAAHVHHVVENFRGRGWEGAPRRRTARRGAYGYAAHSLLRFKLLEKGGEKVGVEEWVCNTCLGGWV